MPATSKFEARVNPRFKEELVLASRLEGTSLTEYVVKHLEPCVKKTLQRERLLELNAEDSRALVAALLDDKARKIPYLEGAAKEYRKRGLDR
ncbi:hypothetical protein BH23VER1_BH23VER1_28120 [soil metagenome]